MLFGALGGVDRRRALPRRLADRARRHHERGGASAPSPSTSSGCGERSRGEASDRSRQPLAATPGDAQREGWTVRVLLYRSQISGRMDMPAKAPRKPRTVPTRGSARRCAAPRKGRRSACRPPSPWPGCTCCRSPFFRSGPPTIWRQRFQRCCFRAPTAETAGARLAGQGPVGQPRNRNRARRAAPPDFKRRVGKLPWACGFRTATQIPSISQCCGTIRAAAASRGGRAAGTRSRPARRSRSSAQPADNSRPEFRLVRAGGLGRWTLLVRRSRP